MPGEFTGKGFEVIGDPSERLGRGCIKFRDGRFRGLTLQSEDDPEWTHDTAAKWDEQWKQDQVEDRALRLRDNPADAEAQRDVDELLDEVRRARRLGAGRDRTTERAIAKIVAGGLPKSWPHQNPRERAMVMALIETSKEFCRPPSGDEVVDAMFKMKDTEAVFLVNSDERKGLVDLLKDHGFGWLEFRGRGFQGVR